MSSNNNNPGNNNRRCAGCKYLRRRCAKDCPLAPYFPPTNPQRFESVHKVFGASNVAKFLQHVAEDRRAEAADCMAYEASLRVSNPVYGCAGMIYQLQEEIVRVQLEIANVKEKIALQHSAQQSSSFSPALQQQVLGGTDEDDQFVWPPADLEQVNINC